MFDLHAPPARADQPEALPDSPWLRRLPLRSPTLPPATHTNLYIVGQGSLALVDPGTPDPDENDRVLRTLAELGEAGHQVAGIVLTHHHYDHSSGLSYLRERLGVPVYAHPETAARLRLAAGDYQPLHEGAELPFGPRGLTVLHTPGHAVGHICLRDNASDNLIVGDMVASVGTILIEVTDGGDMAVYLQSLARLQTLSAAASLRLWPAHGASVAAGAQLLSMYMHHRLMREEKIRHALSSDSASLLQLVARAYDDKPDVDHALAARALLAHLYKLRDEGFAAETAAGLWSRRRGH
jgi:glyoxylase-like metal-dependent hydrolase (beta-lactamase superfamily II)